MANAALHPQTSPPPGAASDWTIPQRWSDYTSAQHAVWDRLYQRQVAQLAGRVAPVFLEGLERLGMERPGIPDFEQLSEQLHKATGWSVAAVPGLVPDAVFFEHLSQRRFVAGRFIRTPEQLDYLQEPDIFHDVFGHVPLLAHPVFADYMQAYGQGGLRALEFGAIHKLARLYWYTVEFGLIREGQGKGKGKGAGAGEGLRIYGAGIVSSHGETRYALEDPEPLRIGFNLPRVLRTRYEIDRFQQNYFVIDSFDSLLRQTLDTDFGPLYAELENAADLDIKVLLPGERCYRHAAPAAG